MQYNVITSVQVDFDVCKFESIRLSKGYKRRITMRVLVKTVSGDSIVSSDVTKANVSWLNSVNPVSMTIEEFQKDFLLFKQTLESITFDGSQNIFIDARDIDYITLSKS